MHTVTSQKSWDIYVYKVYKANLLPVLLITSYITKAWYIALRQPVIKLSHISCTNWQLLYRISHKGTDQSYQDTKPEFIYFFMENRSSATKFILSTFQVVIKLPQLKRMSNETLAEQIWNEVISWFTHFNFWWIHQKQVQDCLIFLYQIWTS